MRFERQQKILELIKEHEICTQENLSELLREAGFKVTQATVSRDIKDLHLIKLSCANGKSRYAKTPGADHEVSERFRKILRETVQSIKVAENIMVIKTLSGCASAAAEAIDTGQFKEIIGSIAGDNTVLLVIDSKEDAPKLLEEFKSIIA